MNIPPIRGPRQLRLLLALLKHPVSVRDLRIIVGALNPAEVVSQLRKHGWRGIIQTRHFAVKDRDGNLCHPGEYFIPEELKPLAEKAVQKYLDTHQLSKGE